MSRRPTPVALPNLEDEDEAFRQKMHKLAEAVLPNDRKAGQPVERKPGRTGAAREMERIEAARGERARYEYVLPKRVAQALAAQAATDGVSATVKLLQILRSSGLPVIPEDLIDLRKLPKR